MDQATTTPRPRLRDHIREKLPEIFVEAFSVALAVVLALAVDNWRDERTLNRQAAALRQAVAAEMRSNLEELRRVLPKIDANLADAERAVKSEDEREQASRLVVTSAVLTAAAWQTTQTSNNAVERLPAAWRIEVAKAYELQELYQRQQQSAMDALVEFTTRREGSPSEEDLIKTLFYQVRMQKAGNLELTGAYLELLELEPEPPSR
ncbi:hypothetical protein M2650_15845 [Luteimonas sp. SX5]|uniref:Uncharacterized protein n=1 Tax=Luteimonas galliterrae TaxID=2940486 RepID=A0ABT0MMH8_9GAMM|nr:hypothetical protein [Luteimonas galliterrae]MCL1636095.1 hypothetical protein [Luteimonas galliterrae]